MSLLLPALLLAAPVVVGEADLKPIELGKKDRAARELVARKQWKAAAKLVTGHRPEVRLVKAWLQQKAGQHEAAVAALKGVGDRLPVLADFGRLVRGRALLALEEYEAAATALEGVRADTGVGRLARRVRARALREAGQLEAGRAAYQSLISSGLPSEIPVGLLGLARLEHEAARSSRAIPLLRRLDSEYPAHWTAGPGRRLASEIVAMKPALEAAWSRRSPEERIARAEKLLKRHRNKAVVEALEPLTKTKMKPALACRHRYALGKALRKRRKWTRAQPLLEASVKLCAKAGSDLAPWARHLAGKAAERLAHEDAAAEHYRAQLKDNPAHRLADDAGYQLVRHFIEDKKNLKAARKAAQKLARTHPEGDMVPDALFAVAVQALLKKDYRTARSMLEVDERLPARPFSHGSTGRTRYWLARLDHLQKRKKKARKGYERVLREAPMTWYALLAYSRLRELGRGHARKAMKTALKQGSADTAAPCTDSKGWALEVPPDLLGPAWERALMLARVGLATPAWSALKEAGAGRGRKDALWLSAVLLDRAGAYPLSHDILRRQVPEFRHLAPHGVNTRKHWHVAYPRPFAAVVKKAAKAAKIDPHFVWAVIREESGFNPAAESFANAVGLMQLILPTAKQMAKKKEGRITRHTLSRPKLNATLGARYLAYVKKKTGAITPLWPAGYNAGAGALRKWVKARGHLPVDLFVETIPYDEARGYTKRVVSSWATYRMLYAKAGKDPVPYIPQRVRGK